MNSLGQFLARMDWLGLVSMLMVAGAALVCITLHELCHGLAALALGDTTAKDAGRLTLNPLRHIDPLGLIMMLTARVGWAKPVPVNLYRFKNPRLGMALTALAGPGCNLVLAAAALLLARGLLALRAWGDGFLICAAFFCTLAVLSAGLMVFNLLPVPPLDGSKILLSLLPMPAYEFVLRYERFVMIALLLLVWSGAFNRPLSSAIGRVLHALCAITGMPFSAVAALVLSA